LQWADRQADRETGRRTGVLGDVGRGQPVYVVAAAPQDLRDLGLEEQKLPFHLLQGGREPVVLGRRGEGIHRE